MVGFAYFVGLWWAEVIAMSEKLCLQWNDFKDNVILSFGSLREDKDFADVTQRRKNLGSRVALLPGKFLRVRKVFLRV